MSISLGFSNIPCDNYPFLGYNRDGNIRYFEYTNDDFIYLSEYKSADAQRGVAFLPKRGVTVWMFTLFFLLKGTNIT